MNSLPAFVDKYRFWFVFVTAAFILEIPFLSTPFKWFESYFHEISHGIAAIMTGGSIIKIELFPNGAGLCTTLGGNRFVISFFGYAGAAICGVLLYSFASIHQRFAQIFSALVAVLLVWTLAFWVRDVLSFVIVCVLLAIILLKFKCQNLLYFQLLLQLIGATVLLNSIKSPWYLIDGRSLGDGAALAELTFIPEIAWVAIWFSIGVLGILFLARTNLAMKDNLRGK